MGAGCPPDFPLAFLHGIEHRRAHVGAKKKFPLITSSSLQRAVQFYNLQLHERVPPALSKKNNRSVRLEP